MLINITKIIGGTLVDAIAAARRRRRVPIGDIYVPTNDKNGRITFLVTLRKYADKDPPEYSVVGYVEHNLATFYQCPPPPGLVDLLLLTGRAAVIFDGLDELLDTSRRADVTARVERFCAEYPQAPVLAESFLAESESVPDLRTNPLLPSLMCIPYRGAGSPDAAAELRAAEAA